MIVSPLPILCSTDLRETWHAKKKGWGHAFHKLAPYVGGFPPRLANYFVQRFSRPGEVVLDPFCGAGTASLEACVRDREGWGNDAFIYGHVVTRAKLQPVSRTRIGTYLKALAAEVETYPAVPLDDEDVRIFYHPATLRDLLKYREILADSPDRDDVNVARAILCAILHGPSKMFLSWKMKETCSSTVGYITRYFHEHAVQPKPKNILACARRKVSLFYADGMPRRRGRALLGDARDLSGVPDASVDFILTSPPYMRVLDYTWNNWLRLWFLGRDRRACREKLVLTASEPKWRRFMRASLAEMYRVLKPGRACIIVVGDVKKNLKSGRKIINSARILGEIAMDLGFTPQCIINDNYTTKNRAMLVYNELKYDSFDRGRDKHKLAMPIDRCLLLTKGAPARDPFQRLQLQNNE